MKKNISKAKKARDNYKKVAKKSKPGSGKRFAALEKAVAAGGAKDPAAVAASIGRKKYGPKKMAKMSVAGRKRKK